MAQAYAHYSHPYYLFGQVYITGHSLLDEYLSSVALTILFAFILYFALSSLSYFLLFHAYAPSFTPLRPQLL